MGLFQRRKSDIGVAISWLAGALVVGATAAVTVTSTAGCMCTAVGWYEGLSIELSPTPLPAGRYHVEVIADGVPIQLSFEALGDGSYQCPPDNGCFVSIDLDDGRRLDLSYDFDMIVVGYDAYGGGPEEAIITIVRDDVEIATEVFTPTYETREPNGYGCGESHTAVVQLSLEP